MILCLVLFGFFLVFLMLLGGQKAVESIVLTMTACFLAYLLPLLPFIVTQSNKQRRTDRRKPACISMWTQCASWPWLVCKIASVSCWLGGMIFNILFYKFVVYSNFVFLLSLMMTRMSTLESSASSLWRSHLNLFATARNGLRLCYLTQKRSGGKNTTTTAAPPPPFFIFVCPYSGFLMALKI